MNIYSRMQQRFIITVILCLFFSIALQAQLPVIAYLEPPLHQTEATATQFLTAAAGGKKPQAARDGIFRSYSLEGPSYHIEYKMAEDTCVAAMVRFEKGSALYVPTLQQIMLASKPFGENRLKQTTAGLLIYELHPQEWTITALSYSFALRSLRKQGY